ncbi:carbohydrate ABC transporter permease [Treponema zuelzerae]|uniref:Carbohydrate ABC transporter permease n=1 Tax=Teretinema zuelzerae TaxID=156 RepID=A0AAE3JIS3_9SPIR|nr:carbohydrate ABC transporter permease [Teretinema zuelzerae]MCD1655557.1 carbohydrate ABC transporter permease [Teretinema zuelzerae]
MPKNSYSSSRAQSAISGSLAYIFISVVAFFSVFPFLWMIIGATNTSKDISMGKLSFGTALIDNFRSLGSVVHLGLVFRNTTIVTLVGTFCTLLVASMAGYGFEMYRSKARERTYSLMLLTMMVPFAAVMIPLFRMFAKARMLNSFAAIILPAVASIFVIFFFRQSTRTFSKELIQASRVDGLGEIQAFFLIYLPSMKSTFAAAAIIVFMSYWNNFLWPLIILQTNNKKLLTLAISSLNSSYTPDYGVIMLVIILATTPTLAIFFSMQRQFVEGMLGSVK